MNEQNRTRAGSTVAEVREHAKSIASRFHLALREFEREHGVTVRAVELVTADASPLGDYPRADMIGVRLDIAID